MSLLVILFLLAFGSYLTVYVLYQLVLFTANAVIREPAYQEPATTRRFNVFVPAHNEELYLPRLLASLQSQDYPSDRYRVTVIADNCSDATVIRCHEAGVVVLERTDPVRRGKGHAIGWALERTDLNAVDAIVIIDGDSMAGPALLKHLNFQMERGDRVIQCYNGVANPGQSWFTRLMDVSRTIANEILHPAKRKLGLSSHLMGNGMCFDVRVLREFGWGAFLVGEDWEYYAKLILSGAYVGYSRLALVYHQESVNLQQASSQRLRWSGGRFEILRLYGPKLLFKGIQTHSLTCLDASLPLVFPNPSLGINLTLLGVVASGLAWLLGLGATFAVWFSVLAALQLAMFLIGVLYTKHKVVNALSLFLAPVFLVWKLGIDILSLCGFGTKRWKPTERRVS